MSDRAAPLDPSLEPIDIGVLAKTCVNKLVAERDEALAQATHSSHRWHELERIQDRQLTVESLQMELAEERVEVERLQKENAAFYSAGCDAIDRNLALQKEVERLQSELQSAIAARDALLGSSKYSPDTIATYAAALEAAFPEDSEAFVAALKDLWKNVHCDLSGELRGPHTELGKLRTRIADLESTLAERDKELEECKGMFTREAQFATSYSDANVDLRKRLAERDKRVAELEHELRHCPYPLEAYHEQVCLKKLIARLEGALREIQERVGPMGTEWARKKARQALNDKGER